MSTIVDIRRLKVNQILVGISNCQRAVLVQFSGRLLISVVGSKIENYFALLHLYKLQGVPE